MPRATNTTLVEQLVTALGGRLEHGRDFDGVLERGDLRVEIKVSVRRKPALGQSKLWHDAAYAALVASPYKITRCECWSDSVKRAFSLKKGGACYNTVSYALVVQGLLDKVPSFYFVCGTHKNNHHLDKTRLVGVVGFSRLQLDHVRALEEKAAALRRKEQDAEDALREAERAARRAAQT